MKAGGRVGVLGRIDLKKVRARRMFEEEPDVQAQEMSERLGITVNTLTLWKRAWRDRKCSPSGTPGAQEPTSRTRRA